jgi:Flp pilus assembly protein TadD/ketosteroid isomerase-like protein
MLPPNMPPKASFSTLYTLRNHVALGVLVGSLWALPAVADEYADVNRLVRAGQTAEALNRADQYLATKPRDPQMRFLKGVVLTETGKTNEAIGIFVKLTEEFPELPEPYNNLAVLYASQNQFDKARQALEMAIRTNPSYATAHENLGDVYAKLASQAYSKALQLDGTNAGVPPKLALIRNLFAPEAKGSRPASAPAAPQAVATPPAAKTAPVAAAPAAPAAPQRPAAAAPAEAAGTEQVVAAVEAWARAWAAKDIDAYLSSYDSQFRPQGGRSRSAWEAERRDRILSKSSISVDVGEFSVKLDDDKATATFRQAYKSGGLAANGRKTLQLVKRNGRWLIARESTT